MIENWRIKRERKILCVQGYDFVTVTVGLYPLCWCLCILIFVYCCLYTNIDMHTVCIVSVLVVLVYSEYKCTILSHYSVFDIN